MHKKLAFCVKNRSVSLDNIFELKMTLLNIMAYFLFLRSARLALDSLK